MATSRGTSDGSTVRATELLMSAQRTGIEADRDGDRHFRQAAVLLDRAGGDNGPAAHDAATALVGLALAEREDELRAVLTPDPVDPQVTWTVACYRIGDLAPSGLRDFSDPVSAVAILTGCPENDHVAAELLASTGSGLRWTALRRINDSVSFQLPSSDTAADASGDGSGDLASALRRWRAQLDEWAGPTVAPVAPVMTPAVIEPHAGPVDLTGVENRLAVLESAVAGMADSVNRLAAIVEGRGAARAVTPKRGPAHRRPGLMAKAISRLVEAAARYDPMRTELRRVVKSIEAIADRVSVLEAVEPVRRRRWGRSRR